MQRVEKMPASFLDAALMADIKATVACSAPEAQIILLILAPAGLTREAKESLRDSLYDVELAHNVVLSVFVYDLITWDLPIYRAMPLHQHIDREGVVL